MMSQASDLPYISVLVLGAGGKQPKRRNDLLLILCSLDLILGTLNQNV